MFPTHLPGEDFIYSWYPIGFALAVGLIFGLRGYMKGPQCPSQEKMKGKTVIVTGANSGIGKEVAKDLASRGARVILACRDVEKGQEAVKEITESTRSKNVVFYKLDLASFQSVKDFVTEFKQEENRLDVLINNAGIMCHPQAKTEEGTELHFGVNYLGHFLLTHLLLDELKTSAPSRVINITALAYQLGEINFDDINLEEQEVFKPGTAYSQSKLAMMLFTYKIAKYLEGSNVTVNAVHPGVVKTDAHKYMPFSQNAFLRISLLPVMWMLMKQPLDGAQTVIYAAVAKEEEGVSGKLYADCQLKKFSENVTDEAADKLWDLSLKMTKVQLASEEE
ncbi:Retinol dehydrogenase 13 [Lamellibrachia satsuma]|nr:Retinol dehydrogenase 13 [Lamellibrachia satsuma]